MHIHIYTHIYIYVHVHLYIHMYIYVYTYIHFEVCLSLWYFNVSLIKCTHVRITCACWIFTRPFHESQNAFIEEKNTFVMWDIKILRTQWDVEIPRTVRLQLWVSHVTHTLWEYETSKYHELNESSKHHELYACNYEWVMSHTRFGNVRHRNITNTVRRKNIMYRIMYILWTIICT